MRSTFGLGGVVKLAQKLSLWVSLLVAGMLAATACDSGGGGSDGEIQDLLTEARVAMFSDDFEGAAEIFNRVLEVDSENVTALVGLAGIHIENNDLPAAGSVFARLDEMELSTSDEVAVQQSRERYLRLVYDGARGDGPANPADAASYEEALIGLFNINPTDDLEREIANRFVYSARAALGVSDVTESLLQNSAIVREATVDQMRAAIEAYKRITERDPRVRRVVNFSEPDSQEAEAMVALLEFNVHAREFRTAFESTVQATLVEAGGFDAATNTFTIFLNDTFEGQIPAAGPERDALRDGIARQLAVTQLTSLYFQVRQIEQPADLAAPPAAVFGRTDAERLEFFSALEVPTFEVARGGAVTIEVRVPFHLFHQTAFLLEQYLEYRAARMSEGTGAAAPEGTGAEATPEGTPGEEPAEATPEGEPSEAPSEEGSEGGSE